MTAFVLLVWAHACAGCQYFLRTPLEGLLEAAGGDLRAVDLLALSVTLTVFVTILGGCVTLMIFGLDVTVAVIVTVGVG
jgi:hypothetical protein